LFRSLPVFLLLLFSHEPLIAQRTCGSILNLDSIEKHDPTRFQRILQVEEHLERFMNIYKNKGIRSTPTVINIPVVVHVLHNGEPVGTGRNISMAQIESQIDVLNEDFRRLNPDATNTPVEFQSIAADVGIEFFLACVDPDGDPTNGVVRTLTTNAVFIEHVDDIKFTSLGGSNAWPTDRDLNIWVGGTIEDRYGNELLGYAQFQDQFATKPNTDGVVIRTV